MRDRAAHLALGAPDIDVKPFEVAGRLGEQVDLRLGHDMPFGHAQFVPRKPGDILQFDKAGHVTLLDVRCRLMPQREAKIYIVRMIIIRLRFRTGGAEDRHRRGDAAPGDETHRGRRPMTILRHYKMIAAEGRGEDLHAVLVDLAAKVSPLPGCEQVQIFADPDDAATYIFIEYWASIEDHKAAGATLGKAAFGPIMAALAGPPEGRYLEAVA